MRCDFVILCEQVQRDANLNACLLGIVDWVVLRALPDKLPPYVLVIRLTGEPLREHQVRIDLAVPAGDVMTLATPSASFNEEGKVEHCMGCAQLPLTAYGNYEFRIVDPIAGVIGRYVLTVSNQQLPSARTPAPVGKVH